MKFEIFNRFQQVVAAGQWMFQLFLGLIFFPKFIYLGNFFFNAQEISLEPSISSS